MPRTYTPTVRFANSGSAALRKMTQAVESTIQYVSDHDVKKEHFSGVLRKAREWRNQVVSYLFKPVPSHCVPAVGDPLYPPVVQLFGSNFASGSRIFLDGVEAPSASFKSISQMEFSASPLVGQDEDLYVVITVIRPDGMSGSRDDIFHFEQEPSINSIAPISGYVQGHGINPPIVVDGQFFKNLSSAKFIPPDFSAPFSGSVTWHSPTRVDIATPQVEITGAYRVQIVSPSGLFSYENVIYTYEYHPPMLSGAVPSTQATDEIKLVVATGSSPSGYFLPSARIIQASGSTIPAPTWDGSSWILPANWVELPVSWQNSSSVLFSASIESTLATGPREIQILHPDGKSSSFGYMNYVLGLPSITLINPINISSGSVIAVTGAHLSSSDDPSLCVSKVTLVSYPSASSTTASFTLINPTTLTFVCPSLAIGNYSLLVSSSAGEGTSLPAITMSYTDIPRVSGILPTSGGEAGGFFARVSGSGFSTAYTVFKVDGITVSASITGSTSATLTMPSHTAGPVLVKAVNYGYLEASASFAYITASSVLSSTIFFPDAGPREF